MYFFLLIIGPASGPEVGAAEHRILRRRSRPSYHFWGVRWRRLGPIPDAVSDGEGKSYKAYYVFVTENALFTIKLTLPPVRNIHDKKTIKKPQNCTPTKFYLFILYWFHYRIAKNDWNAHCFETCWCFIPFYRQVCAYYSFWTSIVLHVNY